MFPQRLAVAVLASIALARAAVLPRNEVGVGRHGAVVTEVAQCSDIGLEMLLVGGSAADAIIAAGLCVGTINAFHSGIGGGGFLLARSGPGQYETIDFRETAPAAASETMFVDSPNKTASTIGGLAVGTPGEIAGWHLLWERHGRLPWAALFQPAIRLARFGFAVPADLAAALDAEEYPFLLSDPLWAETYAPNGTLLKEGETCFRTRFADALEVIANEGPQGFYSGSIAENIVKASQGAGGVLITDDLANYSAIVRAPNNITYRDKARIFSTVAPSSGTVVLSTLKVFEGFNGSAQLGEAGINETTHRLIQATKFGYGERTGYGDPAYTANVTELELESLQPETVEAVRSLIADNETFTPSYYDPSGYIVLDDHGTSHLAAVDEYGGAVSLTTTVNLYWGSQVMTEDGIVLNDEMDDFSSPGLTNAFGFAPSPVNFIRPGKRPTSSIASSIAEDINTGDLLIATGSAGGSRIITATLQNLHFHLDRGYNATQAVHTARFHDQLGESTLFEGLWNSTDNGANDAQASSKGVTPYDNSTVAYLIGLGYNVTSEDVTGSTSHVIVRSADGTLEAANDPRKSAGGGAAY
ncbi:gamma-glutamyltranspeptidase [Schizophyllum commune Loenen D]|nr:gamma-glutamyltranspeptidase [Schizophyllum commune Loenen D]